MKTKAKPKRVQKANFDFTAGYLVQTEFEASGGVRYERQYISEEKDGRKLKAEFLTRKKVDDVELVKDSRSIIWRAYYVMSKHAARTPIGYFADPAMLEELEKEFAEVRELAREFNELSASLGSDRRVKVEIYPLDVSVDNETVARRLAKLVRERLADLRDTLRAADLKEYKEAAERAKNLERLATGIQRDSIRMALEAARDARKALAKRIKDEGAKTPGQARECADALFVGKEGGRPEVDIEAIDAAIDLFTDPEGALGEMQATVEAQS